jgi:NAD(P)H-hydrate repair Nnr-like enzyme with NAD(P)H-hydrate epimerase domain
LATLVFALNYRINKAYTFRFVAVDVPTGMHADYYEYCGFGAAVVANNTV